MPRIPRLCLVTDRHATAGRDLLSTVERALAGGADAVQLREKDLTARELCELGSKLVTLCQRYGASLLINDRLDVALAIGADGVQLPERSFAPCEARQLLGAGRLIGVSRHRVQDLTPALLEGADFVLFGPIFDTPSKRSYGAPLGLSTLREATARSPLPVLAIGGIHPEHVPKVMAAGAYGVATIRALLGVAAPEKEAARFRSALPR